MNKILDKILSVLDLSDQHIPKYENEAMKFFCELSLQDTESLPILVFHISACFAFIIQQDFLVCAFVHLEPTQFLVIHQHREVRKICSWQLEKHRKLERNIKENLF